LISALKLTMMMLLRKSLLKLLREVNNGNKESTSTKNKSK
jgi:hypothetical protein